MRDQLVAFCGEKISESEMLSVFGYTSEQTVIDLTGQILQGKPPDAIDLLHQQSEAGKDMMRLMSDLIAYLRDLLVFKAKPDALSEDVDPEAQKSLAAHAELITNDRLLELIDQFAAAEGRMKWAPNKKLHFEVAVIRAIQTLDQTTLDQVIENLNALRDGNPVAPTAKRSGKDVVTAVADRGADAGYKANESAADVNEIWSKVVAQIKTRRPFIKSWIEEAHPLGASGRNFELGFPNDQRMVMEHLSSRANREFLEALLKEISGREWALKFSLKENLPAKTPAAKSKNAPPIVREALEMFKGEIKT